MWDLTIIEQAENIECLDFLDHKLRAHFGQINGVFARHTTGSLHYILLACKPEFKVKTKELVGSAIADVIINYYKRDYLKDNLILPIANEIDMQAFIKALTTFDSAYDKEIIMKN